VLLEQFLGPPLREEERVGVAGVEEREVKPVLQQGEMRRRHRRARGQPAVGDTAHRELLHGARIDGECLRMRRPLRTPFQHDRAHPAAVEFGREPHAHWAAADHGHVVGVHPGYE
jgi:hypothetical protein